MIQLIHLLLCTIPIVVGEVLPLQLDLDNSQITLRRSASRGDKLQVFHSIWGAIRSDFATDTDKVKGLYSQLGGFVRDEVQCSSGSTGRSACELQQEVRRHLRTLMAQRLANLLNAEESIQTYGMYIAASVEPALVRDILVHAIEDVYFHRPLEKLVQQLEQLYADRDEVSFRTMIEAQLALFWRYQAMQDSSEAFLFNVAHMVSKIRSHHMYASVDAGLQKRVEALGQRLPPVLGLLFDPQGFCLLSRSDREYIYTTITDEWNYGLNGRQVFSWREKNFTDSAGLTRAFVQEQHSTPLFTLRSELFKWYYFVDPSEGNRLAALRSGSPSSSTSTWTIAYAGDALIFRQRDLTLCAAEKFDDDRRLVKMLPGQMHTPPSEACQWLPIACAPPK
ncbi:uncharacterized protein LOC6726155 [Drosophila simulans]|uniref:GD17293 n=1 Tax=Drosophila simulans TaxID=7240 RepID=B4R604_DROSI|nr:uncharacterized protein LOC6726155 [Drosophila simulans]EDX18108.1 GD17293 [Drosophila simulans]KMZ10194.1 uncharacterized protein Dsimw501_GD17293 [Drosophila simulans]